MKILIVTGVVVGALASAFGLMVLWAWLSERRKLVYRPIGFGEQRTLPRYEGVTVAWFWFHLERAAGGWVGVAQLGEETARRPLAGFPLLLDRFEVAHHGGRTFSIRRASCADADFFTRPRFCVPLLGEGEVLRVAAPTRVAYQAGLDAIAGQPRRTPVPNLPLAGAYMIPSVIFGDRDVEPRDVVIHVRNTATGEGRDPTLELVHREYSYHVLGIEEPCVVLPASPPRPGERPTLMPGDLVGRASGGDFVLDLGLYVTRPNGPTVYEIQAECGPYRSETVRVTLEP